MGALRTQMDVALNDMILARWQYRLTKDPLPPHPKSEICFSRLYKFVI